MCAQNAHFVWAIWTPGCLPALLAAERSIHVPPGFEARVLQESEVGCSDWGSQGLHAIGFTPSGDPVVYEGGAVNVLEGTRRRVLAVLNRRHAEFMRLRPDGETVYLGYDTTEVLRIRLDGSSRVLVDDAPAGLPFDDGTGADANDDGALDISDAVHVSSFLSLGGKPIGPPVGACGADPTGHSLPCGSFPGCQ
jgi:hypothetical protein